MRLVDLLVFVFENLARRKGRVALTAVGVVIGTAAVVILVSLAIGLQRNATERLLGIGDLTMIQVMPNYGEMMVEAPAYRMAQSPISGFASSGQTLITDKSLTDLAALPGVVTVIPRDYLQGGGMIKYNRLEGYANIVGIGLRDLSQMGLAAQNGDLILERGTAIVGSAVPSSFYDPRLRLGQEPPSPPDLYNQQVKLILSKWDEQGNEIRKTFPVHIVGTIAESRGEADWSIFMPIEDVTAFNEWFYGRRINRNRDGYPMAMVRVEKLDKVLETADQIKAMGYLVYTPQEMVQGINSFYMVLQVIFGGVGAIALLVAAIGIANTMTMAILERTREIGLMKAVGATNRDVLSIFLGEAAGIGMVGGVGGVLLGWSAGQIINVVALAYLSGQAAQMGGPPPSLAVYTPLWLLVFALVFATLIGLFSGLYPALRAATMIPVTALKYE